MAKPGRKPLQFDLDQIEALASQGLTDHQIIDAIGVGRNAFYRHKGIRAETVH